MQITHVLRIIYIYYIYTMIRNVIFDLDGVLFDGRSFHAKCFIDAVKLAVKDCDDLDIHGILEAFKTYNRLS